MNIPDSILQDQMKFLEEENRSTQKTLDPAIDMADFQNNINILDLDLTHEMIFNSARSYLETIILLQDDICVHGGQGKL